MLSVFITHTQRDIRKVWALLDMYITLIMVMISQVFAYVQSEQIKHTKYLQFFLYHYTSIKLLENKVNEKERKSSKLSMSNVL